jgi:hypothetical protein
VTPTRVRAERIAARRTQATELGRLAALGFLLVLLAPASSARQDLPPWAELWPADPVFVYYERGSCNAGEIDLELWNRLQKRWEPHPVHPRVSVESCQLEDAGMLLNELRWRCLEGPRDELPPAWVVGLNVFDEDVIERCASSQSGSAIRSLQIEVTQPPGDGTVRAAEPRVRVAGQVKISGIRGAAYDIVIAIDVSSEAGDTEDGRADLVALQVAAARDFLRSLTPRLGDVRVSIVAFPELRASGDAQADTRSGVPLTDRPTLLESALRRIEQRGSAGSADLADGLELALDQLAGDRLPLGSLRRGRPAPRRLVLLAADGRGAPFGPAHKIPERTRRRLRALIARTHVQGVTAHVFALGGLPTEPSQLLLSLVEGTLGGVSRVRIRRRDGAADYLDTVRLPYVTRLTLHNATTGSPAEDLRFGMHGEFSAMLPVTFGPNVLQLGARSSDGQTAVHEHRFEFDGSLVREFLLGAERRRIEEARRRREVKVEADNEPPSRK